MARVPLLSADDLPEDYRYLFTDNAVGELNLFRAMGHAPACMQSYMRFGSTLWGECGLPPRERELAILAAARALRSRYEWQQHVALGREAGLSDGDVRAVGRDDLGALADADRALVRYAGAVATGAVTDEDHEAVVGAFDMSVAVGVALLAAYYVATARFVDALSVPLEGDFVGWEPA